MGLVILFLGNYLKEIVRYLEKSVNYVLINKEIVFLKKCIYLEEFYVVRFWKMFFDIRNNYNVLICC